MNEVNTVERPVKPDAVAAMSWDDTVAAIRAESLKMDEVHAKHPGKENRKGREAALRPYIAACVSLHYRRIDLVRFNAGGKPLEKSD